MSKSFWNADGESYFGRDRSQTTASCLVWSTCLWSTAFAAWFGKKKKFRKLWFVTPKHFRTCLHCSQNPRQKRMDGDSAKASCNALSFCCGNRESSSVLFGDYFDDGSDQCNGATLCAASGESGFVWRAPMILCLTVLQALNGNRYITSSQIHVWNKTRMCSRWRPDDASIVSTILRPTNARRTDCISAVSFVWPWQPQVSTLPGHGLPVLLWQYPSWWQQRKHWNPTTPKA